VRGKIGSIKGIEQQGRRDWGANGKGAENFRARSDLLIRSGLGDLAG